MPDPRERPPTPAEEREGVQGGEHDAAADLQETPKVPDESATPDWTGRPREEERSGGRTGGMGGEG